MIGPAYAHAYPEHTLSVGLLSTAAGRTDDDRAKLRAVGEAMENNGIIETLATFVARWFTDDFVEAHPEVIAARLQQVKDTPPDVFLSVFWIYATTEMAPWLYQVACPCLVLTGEFDGGCNPRLNRFIHDQLPDSRLVILASLKHSLMIEASDRVLPHLRDFLLEQI
jgi:pimeloyl-ACP methyl ester carboxylesterase